MFRRLILHIGTHKTGTSAIQKWAHDERRSLLEAGILYPTTGQWFDYSHHHWGFALWNRNKDSALETLKAKLEEEAAPLRHDSLLISSELLEKAPLNKEVLPIMTELIGGLADEIEVVIFLRRQDLLIESIFKQWVKDPTSRLAAQPAPFIEKQATVVDYYNTITRWKAVNKVTKISVTTNALANDPVLDFQKALSLDASKFAVRKENRIVNPTLDGVGLELKWMLNAMKLPVESDKKILQAILRTDLKKETLSLFEDDAREALARSFEASNTKLCEEYGAEPFSTVLPKRDRLFGRLSGHDFFTTMQKLAQVDEKVVWHVFDFVGRSVMRGPVPP